MRFFAGDPLLHPQRGGCACRDVITTYRWSWARSRCLRWSIVPRLSSATGPNQVRLDEFNQWASPLQNSISRVVAENLVAMLGTPRVTLSPQTLSADADYRAAIEVQGFESSPGEAAVLDAVWTVRRAKDGKAQTGRTTVREVTSDKGYDALAAAHSRALARLSLDIADAVRALERSGQ